MVLISVAIIGLNAAFSTISATTRDLTLRQKAIIAVNNEMERLYGIYDQNPGDLTGQLVHDDIDVCDPDDPFPPYTGDIADFMVEDNNPANIGAISGVYIYTSGPDTYNVVPIDFEHDITGRLELCGTDDNDDYYDVTLTLRYPYRFRNAANPIDATDPTLFNVDTVQVTTSLAK